MPYGAVAGGDASRNLQLLKGVLEGKRESYCGAVLMNAGALLYVADKAESIKDGVATARAAIADGRAKNKLEEWIAATQN